MHFGFHAVSPIPGHPSDEDDVGACSVIGIWASWYHRTEELLSADTTNRVASVNDFRFNWYHPGGEKEVCF